MRLFLLVALTMIAFAANSVLNRLALEPGDMGPASFAAIRLVSGALILAFLVLRERKAAGLTSGLTVSGPLALAIYMVGFSFGYVTLDAGVGALILFGGVQITMFAGAVFAREVIPLTRWAGAAVAFAGLGWLMWPSGGVGPDIIEAGLMIAAAVGWGIYSLLGRGAVDPLSDTARNFILATPIGLIVWALVPDETSVRGIWLAVASGAITSGLGYALWYKVLPELPATVAAIAMLTVPVLAVFGGIVFLGEAPGQRFVIATILVIGGVLISLYTPSRKATP